MPRSARPTSVESQPETCSTIRVSGWNGGIQTSSNQNPIRSDQSSDRSNLNPAASNLNPDSSNLNPDSSNLSQVTSDLNPTESNLNPPASNLSLHSANANRHTSNLSRAGITRNSVFLNKTPISESRVYHGGPRQRRADLRPLTSDLCSSGRVRFTSLLALCTLLIALGALPFVVSTRAAADSSPSTRHPSLAWINDRAWMHPSNSSPLPLSLL